MFLEFEFFRGVDITFHFSGYADLFRLDISFDVALLGNGNCPRGTNCAFELAVQTDRSRGSLYLALNLDSRFKQGNDFLVRHRSETFPMFLPSKIKAHKYIQ